MLALEATDDGLWITSDTDFLAGRLRPRLAFMPLTGGYEVKTPTAPTLPTTLYRGTGTGVMVHGFDGSTVSTGTPTVIADPLFDGLTGATLISGALVATRSGAMEVIGWDGAPAGEQPIDLRGLSIPLDTIDGLTYDFELRRLYYTTGDAVLRWRHFEPDQAILGAEEFVTNTGAIDLTDVRGLAVVGGLLVWGSSSGELRSAPWIDGAPTGPTQIISGPAIDGLDWSSRTLFALSPGTDFLPPAESTLASFSGVGSDTSLPWQVFSFTVPSQRDLDVQIDVADAAADMRFFLRDPSGATVARSVDPGAARRLLTANAVAGEWSIGVRSRGAGSTFSIDVNPVGGTGPQVTTLSSCGTATTDRWQTLDVVANAGDPIRIDLDWDDAGAEIYAFLRDPNGNSIGSDRTPGVKPRSITAVATESGTWLAAANIKSGAACFDLTATVGATDEPIVSTLSSCGTPTMNSWQTLDIDALAGDPINVDLDWDDAGAEIFLFLRDPTGGSIGSSRGAGLKPRSLSTTATVDGSYLAAVSIKSGAPCFDLTGTVGEETNSAPTIDPIADRAIAVGADINISVVASDSDGDTLAYSAIGLPSGVLIDTTTGSISGSATATGSSSVTVTVDDGTETASTVFQLLITPALTSNGARLLISNTASAGYLDAPGAAVSTVATPTAASVWILEDPDNDGQFALRNEASGRYLDGDAGGVDTYINADRNDRLWMLDPVTGDVYRIRNDQFDLLVQGNGIGAVVGWDSGTPEPDDEWMLTLAP